MNKLGRLLRFRRSVLLLVALALTTAFIWLGFEWRRAAERQRLMDHIVQVGGDFGVATGDAPGGRHHLLQRVSRWFGDNFVPVILLPAGISEQETLEIKRAFPESGIWIGSPSDGSGHYLPPTDLVP